MNREMKEKVISKLAYKITLSFYFPFMGSRAESQSPAARTFPKPACWMEKVAPAGTLGLAPLSDLDLYHRAGTSISSALY